MNSNQILNDTSNSHVHTHPTLTAIIITKNSAKTIKKCLESIRFANEVIILDSGSTDETVSICQQYTTHVFQTDWPGFGPQKNRALEKATSDWVFSIDSDEWVDDALRFEILNTMQYSSHVVFMMPRLNQYCGQWIYHGDAGKDKVTRLFKRGAAHFSDDKVHEKIITSHHIEKLKSRLHHNTYASLEALISRLNTYSTLSAEMRFARSKKTNLFKAIISSAWIFTRSYFIRRGFLDGKMGLIIAIHCAESSYYRHIKLIELHTILS